MISIQDQATMARYSRGEPLACRDQSFNLIGVPNASVDTEKVRGMARWFVGLLEYPPGGEIMENLMEDRGTS